MGGDRDGEIGETAIRLARGQVAPGTAIEGHLRWELFRRRLGYGQVVGRLVGRGPLRESVWTEEMWLLRALGRRLVSSEAGGGRQTRNSSRGLEAVKGVGTEDILAACSGMEWQRGVAGL